MLSDMTNGVVENKAESEFGSGLYDDETQTSLQEHEPTEQEKKDEVTRQTMADPDTRKLVYDATEYLIKKGIIKPNN